MIRQNRGLAAKVLAGPNHQEIAKRILFHLVWDWQALLAAAAVSPEFVNLQNQS